jgi:hypothetical protein
MEKHVVYIVQFWVKGYEYWHSCAEPTTGMFDLPQVGFEQEDEGLRKLIAMREANPTGTYRLVRQTTTVDVLS